MAKKKVRLIPAPDTQKWLTTFNDLMTLLLTFFVLLISMSSLQEAKIKELHQQIIDGLGLMEAGREPEETIIERIFTIEQIGRVLKIFKTATDPVKEGEHDPDRIQELEHPKEIFKDVVVDVTEGREHKKAREDDIFHQLKNLVHEDLQIPGITLRRDKRGVVLSFAGELLFPSASTVLYDSSLPVLEKFGNAVKDTDFNIHVEGHTDSLPIRTREFPSNWELSTGRAVSVVDFLVNYCNIKPSQIAASGYADAMPLVPDITEENRRKNRRIEIVLSQF